MRKKHIPILMQMILYIIQFVIIPSIIDIYPSDVHRHFLIIAVTTMVVSLIGMILFSCYFRYWVLGGLIYFILVNIYHPTYIYGIDYGILPKIISIIGLMIMILLFEFAMWVLIKLYKYILKKQKHT